MNWLHHRFQYRHHQHHYITIRRARFGLTNSISNHFHSVHRSMGELKFDIWFSRFLHCKQKKRTYTERSYWPTCGWSNVVFLNACLCWIKLCDAVRLWLVMIPSSNATLKRNTASTKKQQIHVSQKNVQSRMACVKRKTFSLFCHHFFGWNFIRMKWSRLLDKTQSEMQSVQFGDHLHLHALTLIGLHVQMWIEWFFTYSSFGHSKCTRMAFD